MAINLTNAIAFENIKIIEEHDKTESKQVYGYGVRGNKFKLVKKSDFILSRIWFSFLKALRFIKVNKESIEKVKSATLTHISTSDYKNWSLENAKITKQGLLSLVNRNKELENQNTLNKATQEGLLAAAKVNQETIKTYKKELKTLKKEIASSKTKISDCESKRSSLEKELNDDTIPAELEKTPIKVLEKKFARLKKENDQYRTFVVENYPNQNIEELIKPRLKKAQSKIVEPKKGFVETPSKL